ncbi:MAG: outer membrane lipoprotein-sorting protein [Candidatus Omnitrophica bacterium]|nr:outer membrane lipoprotein-sorting protein [Candidatus Omnitrophota bacterium]
MRKMLFLFFILSLFWEVLAGELEYYKLYTPQEGMSAEEIMQIKYHNKYSLFAKDYYLPYCEVYYVDASGFTRKKIAKRFRIVKGGEDGISYKDLVVITYPTEIKGLAILTWTYTDPNKYQDVWLWVPSLKKVRKISASEDEDAFMGSDLTVEEVSTRKFEDESYRLIGEENFKGYKFEHSGEMKFEGKPCFVIECVPKQPHWYYAKRIIWVTKDTGGNIFEEYYDKNGKLFKTIFRDWAIYEPGTKNYPTQHAVECKDLRTGHRTTVLNLNQEYDKGISEQEFTVKALMRSKW